MSTNTISPPLDFPGKYLIERLLVGTDKFVQKYGDTLDDEEREEILEKVKETFQLVNETYHDR